MRVGAYQFDVRRGDVEANVRAALAGLRQAAAEGVELVVLPEMWPTSFVDPAVDATGEEAGDLLAASDRALARVAELSSELDLIVAGTAFGPGDPARGLRNRLHVFEAGRLILHYDKVHLFTPTGEPLTFAPGNDPPPTAVSSIGRLSGAICYDVRFPELFRAPFRCGAELLLLPAQWPVPRAAHWRALVIARAVENQCFAVAANRCGADRIGRDRHALEFPGGSLVVDPDGRVLAEGGASEGLIAAEVDFGLVRALRERVPIEKDQRPDLYRAWLERGGS
jgi:predicted amidohydrolase